MQSGGLYQEAVLKQWEWYVARYFSSIDEFDNTIMDMYMRLVL